MSNLVLQGLFSRNLHDCVMRHWTGLFETRTLHSEDKPSSEYVTHKFNKTMMMNLIMLVI